MQNKIYYFVKKFICKISKSISSLKTFFYVKKINRVNIYTLMFFLTYTINFSNTQIYLVLKSRN